MIIMIRKLLPLYPFPGSADRLGAGGKKGAGWLDLPEGWVGSCVRNSLIVFPGQNKIQNKMRFFDRRVPSLNNSRFLEMQD